MQELVFKIFNSVFRHYPGRFLYLLIFGKVRIWILTTIFFFNQKNNKYDMEQLGFKIFEIKLWSISWKCASLKIEAVRKKLANNKKCYGRFGILRKKPKPVKLWTTVKPKSVPHTKNYWPLGVLVIISGGRQFKVKTDHGSLTWLKSFKNQAGMIVRWISVLDTYNLEFEHRRSSLHGNADGLPKNPNKKVLTLKYIDSLAPIQVADKKQERFPPPPPPQ